MKKEEKEKATIKPSKFEIFGIPAESTEGNAIEIMEMMAFLGDCKNDKVLHYLTGLTYDSKASRCVIGTARIVQIGDPVGSSIYRKAAKCFRAFTLFGEEIGMSKIL